MDEFEVTVFGKGGAWDGKRVRFRRAVDAKAAAEAVLKMPLRPWGQPRELRATVWKRGDPSSLHAKFYQPVER